MLSLEAHSNPRRSVNVRVWWWWWWWWWVECLGDGGQPLADYRLVVMVIYEDPKILPKRDFLDLVEDSF